VGHVTSAGAPQLKALAAQRAVFFDAEIVPVSVPQRKGDALRVSRDERPRDTTLDALAKLKGVVRPDGSVTAGHASGVNDGACALLLADQSSAARHGQTPRARVVGMAMYWRPARTIRKARNHFWRGLDFRTSRPVGLATMTDSLHWVTGSQGPPNLAVDSVQ
jgi:Thiolase, N-terminal domain